MTELMLGPEELTPIPYIERCDYKDFLAELVRCHGETYLQRPDGTLLDGVVFIPQPRPKRQKPKRQVPTLPPGYTGNPMDDFQPQMKGLQVMVEYERPDGSVTVRKDGSIKSQVLAAIAEKPLTLPEIVRATGLTNGQVKNTLFRYNGKLLEPATDRATNNKWRLLAAEKQPDPQAPREPTIRERIEQHVTQNGPSSSSDLSQALGVKRDIIYTTCHEAKTLTVVGKLNEKVVLWGLVERGDHGQQTTSETESVRE